MCKASIIKMCIRDRYQTDAGRKTDVKKHMTIKQTNRILAFVIVFLVLLIAVYFVKRCV